MLWSFIRTRLFSYRNLHAVFSATQEIVKVLVGKRRGAGGGIRMILTAQLDSKKGQESNKITKTICRIENFL